MPFARVTLAAMLSLALSGPLRADPSAWTHLSPSSPPNARKDASLIFDAGNDRLVLFGGKSSASNGGSVTYYQDVWVFSMSSRQWSTLTTSGTPPSARSGHAAIYDPGRTGVSPRMLVFGGRTSSGLAGTEVFALALTGTASWSTVSTSGTAPGAREDHVAVYDSGRDQMIVHGGSKTGSTFALALNLSTPAWSALAASSGWSDRSSAIYDQVGQRMIVFGGVLYPTGICPAPSLQSGSNVKVLRLDLVPPSWTDLSDAPWSGRADPAGVYDSIRRKLILFGGVNARDTCVCQGSSFCGIGGAGFHMDLESPYADVWVMDLATNAWSQFSPTGTPPPYRGHHVAAYYPARDEMIAFGGSSFSSAHDCTFTVCSSSFTHTYYNDTWQFDSDAIAPAAVSLDATGGCYDHIFVGWTAPGDDGSSGTATAYDLRWSTSAITELNFSAATPIAIGAPLPAGEAEANTVSVPYCSANRYYAVKTRDEAFNWSGVSNSLATKPVCPAPPAQCFDASARRPREEPPLEASPTAMEFANPEPNPAGDGIWFRWGVPKDRTGTGYELAVFDLAGRRIAVIERGSAVAGTRSIFWNLQASDGNRVRPGMFVVRFRLGSNVLTRRIVTLP